jgi:hypothetical protein
MGESRSVPLPFRRFDVQSTSVRLAARRMKEEDNDLYVILLYLWPTATVAVEDLFLQKQLGL